MRRVLFFLISFVVLMLLAGCGGGYINKSFKYEKPPVSVKLALIPAVVHERDFVDSMSVILFEDSGGAQELVAPARLRRMVETDEKLRLILNKIGSSKYSKADYDKGPSLQSSLSEEELAYLRTATDNADLILFPVSLAMSDPELYTTGVLTMRLYDLHTGVLIYERERDLLVEGAGEHGRKFLALGLLSKARDDYIKNYRDRHLSR